jgi:FkbM family methyltransferase
VKTLQLLGRDLEFEAAPNDHYLEHMGIGGPVDLIPIFQAFLKPGDTVVDVGANIGVTAAIEAILVEPGRVLAIEALPETFGFLSENLAGSGLTGVSCVNAAAAAAPGAVEMIVHPGWGFGAFVGYENVLDRYRDFTAYQVPARTLDQLVEAAELDRVDFVKIDVEGFELEVLRGASRVLQEHRPTVILEANHYCLNVFRRLSIVDFLEEVLDVFPVVLAVDTDFLILDLTDTGTHQHFFHENVVSGRFPNLLCGFSDNVRPRAASLAAAHEGVSTTD